MMMMGDKKKLLQVVLGPHEKDGEKIEAPEALHAIAQELIEAVANHDVKGVADALRAAFMECDAEPHVEGPHID